MGSSQALVEEGEAPLQVGLNPGGPLPGSIRGTCDGRETITRVT